jgi:hypothetical protein
MEHHNESSVFILMIIFLYLDQHLITLNRKVYYGTKESFVNTKKIPHTEIKINEGFVGLTKPKRGFEV